MYYACQHGNVLLINLLEKNGARIDSGLKNENGNTMMHAAFMSNNHLTV